MRGNNSGFNLVELMVVVALVGVLSSIAIPSYIGFQAKARMAEAKVMLGVFMKAEHVFWMENGSFTTCANAAGFSVTPAPNSLFSVGFRHATASVIDCGPGGNQICNQQSYTDAIMGDTCATNGYFSRAAMSISGPDANDTRPILAPPPLITTPMGGISSIISRDAFKVLAAGYVTDQRNLALASRSLDVWSINQNGVLIHERSGIR